MERMGLASNFGPQNRMSQLWGCKQFHTLLCHSEGVISKFIVRWCFPLPPFQMRVEFNESKLNMKHVMLFFESSLGTSLQGGKEQSRDREMSPA